MYGNYEQNYNYEFSLIGYLGVVPINQTIGGLAGKPAL